MGTTRGSRRGDFVAILDQRERAREVDDGAARLFAAQALIHRRSRRGGQIELSQRADGSAAANMSRVGRRRRGGDDARSTVCRRDSALWIDDEDSVRERLECRLHRLLGGQYLADVRATELTEVVGHQFETFAEPADFVVAHDDDSLLEVATTQLVDRARERSEGADDDPRKVYRAEDRE